MAPTEHTAAARPTRAASPPARKAALQTDENRAHNAMLTGSQQPKTAAAGGKEAAPKQLRKAVGWALLVLKVVAAVAVLIFAVLAAMSPPPALLDADSCRAAVTRAVVMARERPKTACVGALVPVAAALAVYSKQKVFAAARAAASKLRSGKKCA